MLLSVRKTPTCDRCGAPVASYSVSNCEPCRAELLREIIRFRDALKAQLEREGGKSAGKSAGSV